MGHKLTTFASYCAVSGGIIKSLIASTLPDLVEMGPGRLFFKKHRGTSHNPLFWLITLPALFYLFRRILSETGVKKRTWNLFQTCISRKIY
jgi:hypothetical protein